MKLWHCNDCGKEWTSDAGVHFHACLPRQRYQPPLTYPTLEDAWLQTWVDYAGGYRPPTPEQARAETRDRGRRKDGTGRKRR